MPARKSARKSTRKSRSVNVNVNVGVTTRTWVLFAMFLAASAYTFYLIFQNRY